MVSSLVVPAVMVAEPMTSSLEAEAGLTDQVAVSVKAASSVTVIVWLPEVRKVAALVKV